MEAVIFKAVFLAPKVYAYITESGTNIIKIKGLTKEAIKANNIRIYDLENLLIKDSTLEVNQESGNRNDLKTYLKVILQLKNKFILSPVPARIR